MSDANKTRLSVNITHLPPEMVERILKFLKLKEICQARLICKRWKEIIDKGNLVKDAAGNDFNGLTCMILFLDSMYSVSILILPYLNRKAFCNHFPSIYFS